MWFVCLAVSGPSVDGPVSQPLVILPPPGGQEAGGGVDRPSSLALGAAGGGGGGAAPPPPPRTRTGHSRSSSLDTQLVDLEDSHRGNMRIFSSQLAAHISSLLSSSALSACTFCFLFCLWTNLSGHSNECLVCLMISLVNRKTKLSSLCGSKCDIGFHSQVHEREKRCRLIRVCHLHVLQRL